MSPTTAHALAVVAFCTMFLCWGIAYVMLRLEHRSRRIGCNTPRKSSESDHSKAPSLVPLSLAGTGFKNRDAFGLTHGSNLVPLDALSVAREERGSAEGYKAEATQAAFGKSNAV